MTLSKTKKYNARFKSWKQLGVEKHSSIMKLKLITVAIIISQQNVETLEANFLNCALDGLLYI